MPDNVFRPRPGRFGVESVLASVVAATLTANTDTVFYVPTPARKCRLSKASAQCSVVAVDSDGTTTAIVAKVSSGTTTTALSSALNIEGLTAKVASVFSIPSTVTEPQRSFAVGDVAKVTVTNSSAAIDTQPSDLVFVLEFELKE